MSDRLARSLARSTGARFTHRLYIYRLSPFAVHLFTKYALRFGTNAAFQVREIRSIDRSIDEWDGLAADDSDSIRIDHQQNENPIKHQSMLAGPDGQLDSKRRLLAGLGAGVTEAILIVTPFDVVRTCF